MGVSFHPSYCVKRKFGYLQKLAFFASAILSQTPDIQNFASVYRSSKRVINLARERWVLRA